MDPKKSLVSTSLLKEKTEGLTSAEKVEQAKLRGGVYRRLSSFCSSPH